MHKIFVSLSILTFKIYDFFYLILLFKYTYMNF